MSRANQLPAALARVARLLIELERGMMAKMMMMINNRSFDTRKRVVAHSRALVVVASAYLLRPPRAAGCHQRGVRSGFLSTS